MDDMDLLAAGTIAGHIVECGAQCTGGNFIHWEEIPDMARIGYPVIEANPDGTFVVTKHENTGGRVTVETVTSQLVYEMGNPASYITPDCVADFTTIQLKQDGPERVGVSGIKGKPATDTYKVSISFHEGYKILSQLTVAGPDAVAKAKLCADIVFERAAMDGVEFKRRRTIRRNRRDQCLSCRYRASAGTIRQKSCCELGLGARTRQN